MASSSSVIPRSSRGFSCHSVGSNYINQGPAFVEYLSGQLNRKRDPNESTASEGQIQAVLSTREYFKTGGTSAAVIVAPSGAGKLGIATMLPYCLESRKALFLAPSKANTAKLAQAFGGGVGGIKESFFWNSKIILKDDELLSFLENPIVISEPEDSKHIIFANIVILHAEQFDRKQVACLMNRSRVIVKDPKETFRKFDTIIVYDSQHYPAQTWETIVDWFGDKKVVFLSATAFKRELGGGQAYVLPTQYITHYINKCDYEGTLIKRSEFQNFDFGVITPTRRSCLEDVNIITQIGVGIRTLLTAHDVQYHMIRHKAICFVRTSKEAKSFAGVIHNATIYTADKSTHRNLEDFNDPDGPYDVVVCCESPGEGFKNASISVCVILKNVRTSSTFSELVSHCLSKNPLDTAIAAVRSVGCYDIQERWEEYDVTIALDDPAN